MTGRSSLTSALRKGDSVRTTKPLKFTPSGGVSITYPTGERGVVTSVSEIAVFAKFGSFELELLPGEWERAE